MVIPNFNAQGLLPPGTYRATFDQLRASILVSGPTEGHKPKAWDSAWRSRLVDSAQVLVGQLWAVGVEQVFLDGSFVEAKPHPNDIDGYFECDPVELARGRLQEELNRLDTYKVWTWAQASRRPAAGSTKRQLPMWHRYRVEMYPHFPGLSSGILDRYGNEMQFPAAFRTQRDTNLEKGIVQIVPSGEKTELLDRNGRN